MLAHVRRLPCASPTSHHPAHRISSPRPLALLAALGFGAQSIVGPLGSVTLVSNTVIAPAFLGERITMRDIVATFLITAGAFGAGLGQQGAGPVAASAHLLMG